MTPPTIRRLLPAAIVAAGAALAVAAGPASAAKPLVHQTPKVPLVVDGKRMAPEQIHRFDGKPLYMHASADGKKLIATTSLAKYKAFLKTQGVTLPRPGAKAPTKARASYTGHWGRIWTDNFLRGYSYTVNSGLGVANMNALYGCPWFGGCWNFENTVSSVDTYGRGMVLFDLPNFNGYWGSLYIGPNIQADLQVYGFNDRASSVYTDW